MTQLWCQILLSLAVVRTAISVHCLICYHCYVSDIKYNETCRLTLLKVCLKHLRLYHAPVITIKLCRWRVAYIASRCVGCWPHTVTSFNTDILTLRDWLWWIGMRPCVRSVSVTQSSAIMQIVLSSVKFCLTISGVDCFWIYDMRLSLDYLRQCFSNWVLRNHSFLHTGVRGPESWRCIMSAEFYWWP